MCRQSPARADLVLACKAFLETYEKASEEYHFGQILDSAFAEVLEPMYTAIAEIDALSAPSPADRTGTGE